MGMLKHIQILKLFQNGKDIPLDNFPDECFVELEKTAQEINKPELSRSCRASFKNLGQHLGQKFGGKCGTKFGTNRQTVRWTDGTKYKVALQLKIGVGQLGV